MLGRAQGTRRNGTGTAVQFAASAHCTGSVLALVRAPVARKSEGAAVGSALVAPHLVIAVTGTRRILI